MSPADHKGRVKEESWALNKCLAYYYTAFGGIHIWRVRATPTYVQSGDNLTEVLLSCLGALYDYCATMHPFVVQLIHALKNKR